MMRGPKSVWWGLAAVLALGAGAAPAAAQPLRTPMTETGTPGGRFVIGTLSEARTFNPILSNETSSSDVSDRLFTALTETDNVTRRNRPALARSWEVSRDGLTWTWHLRRGARFSDGHPITAADVLFCFAVAYDSTLHPSVQELLSPHGRRIQVSAPDSYTVVMRLARPHALLVQAVGALRILPRHVLEPAWRAGRFASTYGVGTHPDSLVTSGPWRLKQYVPHEKTVLTRNPYWFGVDARGRRLPYLDELVYLVVPDQNTLALRFEAGVLDALDNVKAEDYRRFRRGQERGGYVVHRLGASLTSNFLWFNLNTVKRPGGPRPVGAPYADPVRYAWFSNRDFRRAVSMAVDREAIVRSVYFGEGARSWSILTPGYGEFHDPSVTAPDHDPAGARRLLARIGFRDRDGDGVVEDPGGRPVRFTLKTNAGSVRVAMANFVRDDLARVGIRCDVAAVDYTSLIVNMREDFEYDAILAGLGAAVPPDPAMCGNFYRSSGATHFWNLRQSRPETAAEARVDSLFGRLLLPGPPAQRRSLAARMDRILNEECWLIWLPVMRIELPVRARFGNLAPNLLPHRVLWNIETVFVKPRGAGRGR
jgi:peptide/nickel transport system substrate-binding protein